MYKIFFKKVPKNLAPPHHPNGQREVERFRDFIRIEKSNNLFFISSTCAFPFLSAGFRFLLIKFQTHYFSVPL